MATIEYRALNQQGQTDIWHWTPSFPEINLFHKHTTSRWTNKLRGGKSRWHY